MLKWFGHMERKKNEEFVKKLYVNETEDPRRGKLFVWKDRVKGYMHESGADRGGGIKLARRECLDRKRWKLFCRGHPLRDFSRWKEMLETINICSYIIFKECI